MRSLLPLYLLLLSLAGCRTPGPATTPEEDLGQDHPLLGRIWDARAETFVDQEKVIGTLLGSRFVLLGEKHDNPHHHLIQARLLSGLLRMGRRPTLVWEMITDEQQPKLDNYLAGPNPTATGLGLALGWNKSGWPPWHLYRPIAEAALPARLPMRAAGISRKQLMKLAHASSQPASSQPASSQPAIELPEAALKDLKQVIIASHCGHSNERMAQMMIKAQLMRDARMARRMAEADAKQGAVLIAGNGHTRRDRAVPFQLRKLHPDSSAISVGAVEVQRGHKDPRYYAAGAEGLGPVHDFLFFTLRVDNLDPCEQFREQLKKMRARPRKR